MSVRILIVEDYEPFRRFVCSALGKRAELQVIGEVSDGPEGVEKAKELKPDLILLDIRLPTLDGIEVARRIDELVPESKIVFLSMEYSIDVVQKALSLGALGYVEKLSSAAEIHAAVEAVCQGNPYVSLSCLPRRAPSDHGRRRNRRSEIHRLTLRGPVRRRRAWQLLLSATPSGSAQRTCCLGCSRLQSTLRGANWNDSSTHARTRSPISFSV